MQEWIAHADRLKRVCCEDFFQQDSFSERCPDTSFKAMDPCAGMVVIALE